MSSDSPERGRARFASLRVLLLEDEFLVAMLIEEMLHDIGFAVVDVASTVDGALDKVGATAVDLAVLDVNINGQTSFPVADRLAGKAVPFLFSTGYGSAGVLAAHAHVPTLRKPFQQAQLLRAVTELLATS